MFFVKDCTSRVLKITVCIGYIENYYNGYFVKPLPLLLTKRNMIRRSPSFIIKKNNTYFNLNIQKCNKVVGTFLRADNNDVNSDYDSKSIWKVIKKYYYD